MEKILDVCAWESPAGVTLRVRVVYSGAVVCRVVTNREFIRQNCEKRLLATSCVSFRSPAWNSAPIGRIFMEFDVGFSWNLMSDFHEIRCRIFMKFDVGFS